MSFLSSLFNQLSGLLTWKSVSASVALAVSSFYLYKNMKKETIPILKLSEFNLALSKNVIAEIILENGTLFFRPINTNDWYQTYAPILKGKNILKILKDHPGVQFSCAKEVKEITTASLISLGLSFASLGILYQLASSQGFLNGFTGGQVKSKSNVKFNSIYGLDHAKKQLRQIIDFLTHPDKFKQIGARLRRGVIIFGPPGTGKTMLAKATANESGVNFMYCSATEFIEMYVGMGPKRVRALFNAARQKAPTIIFIDEIDSISLKRKNQNLEQQQNESERDNTLNQLLMEIDGFNETDNIVVIAATNRIHVIDEALMRSGRFDIKIQVKLPDYVERLGILKIHLQKKKHNCSEQALQQIAQQSDSFSGADMENITNESAYITIEDSREIIEDNDILNAFYKLKTEKSKTQSTFQQKDQMIRDQFQL